MDVAKEFSYMACQLAQYALLQVVEKNDGSDICKGTCI